VSEANQNHRDLWVAVITRAVLDAGGLVLGDRNPAEIVAAIRQARAWLTDDTPDFREVCGMAGVDPEAILRVTRSGNLETLVAEYRNRFNGWNVNNG
jgi:hypothetical protein